jgi:hypothetical protein
MRNGFSVSRAIKLGSKSLATYSVRCGSRVDGVQEQCIRASLVVCLQNVLREEVLEHVLPGELCLVTRFTSLATVSPSHCWLRVNEGSATVMLESVILEPRLSEVCPLKARDNARLAKILSRI